MLRRSRALTRLARRALVAAVSCAIAASCAYTPPNVPTDGVDLPLGPCGHGLLVLSSNYTDTSSLAIIGFDGRVASESILSGASASVGLSAPLSGDVVLPTTPPSEHVVLLDRAAVGQVLTFDPPAARVKWELPVDERTNPHDYLQIDAQKAYVTRFDRNPHAGSMPFDRGGDIAILDTSKVAVVSSLLLDSALASLPSGALPHPGRMVRTSEDVLVLVANYSADYKTEADSVLVRLDPTRDTVNGVVPLTGLRGCMGLALSPNGKEIAVGCSGEFGGSTTPMLSSAGVVVLDATSFAPVRAWKAAELGAQAPGFSLTFVTDDALLVPMTGSVDGATVDHLLRAELPSGAVSIVATAQGAFELGEVACATKCGACFATVGSQTDASHNRVMRLSVDAGGAVTGEADLHIKDGGLQPRYLGLY